MRLFSTIQCHWEVFMIRALDVQGGSKKPDCFWDHITLQRLMSHCYNPVAPAYPIWAYYVHGRQRRCQEDPVSLPSGRLEHYPTGSETTPLYAPRSNRFGSEPPSVEDDVDVWRYAILSCTPETTTTTPHLFCAATLPRGNCQDLDISKN